jgi:endonuclease YncB( thermonuclease family)
MTWKAKIIIALQLCFVIVVSGCSASAKDVPHEIVGSVINSVYWSDGDSGRIDGVKFRLANVDAPETGSLKQRGGAKCESEREIGYEAKAFLVALTKTGTVQVERDYGYDRYKRLVVDLSVNGQDIGKTAVTAGHIKAWPHRKGRAQAPKPDWCATNP